MSPEQLRIHRELESLRAEGAYTKRRRPKNSKRKQANRQRIIRRRVKLEQTNG